MKNLIIIGAGPAGLTAGYEILKRSQEYRVIILEESDCIGGISKTVRYKGCRMDIGGHRFFSKSDRVNKMWQELCPKQGAPAYDDKKLGRERELSPGGPDPEKTDRVMLRRTRVSRIYFGRKFFDYPISGKVFGQMGLLMTVKAGFSYLASIFRKLPEDNLENFYINRFGRVLYSMFFEGYTEKLWGRHPREISADWGAQRVKGLSVLAVAKNMAEKVFKGNNRKVETSLIEEFDYPKYGPGQLWEICAEKIREMGGDILTGCEVKSVLTEDGKVTGVVYVNGGEKVTLHGDIVISSMPVKDLAEGMENVPENILKITRGLPYRDFMTVGLRLRKMALVNKTDIKTLGNIVPDCWIYVQDPGMKMGRIQIFNNWSPYMNDDPENSVWLGLEYFCAEGDEDWLCEDRKFAARAVKELLKMGVIADKSDALDYHVERVKKAYPAYFDTYEGMGEVIKFLDTFGNLYCVGRNGQHRYNNMDHSMMTAFETVDNILSGKTSKENVWNVNTEKEYHEEKKQ
ncbi:MAG: NAD(P)/FAD-dependent oxidoreductase [Oscillospiraceae bacterium]|nr:NAD(P)/FAD-dependent oxidoreductase [Oscillospiraceae bacterium]